MEPRPTRLFGALVGAALGWGAWQAAARSLPEADPARWTLRGPSVPLEAPTSAGPLRPDPAALDLWAYRGASPLLPASADSTFSLEARVPTDGQLIVRLGAEATAGPLQPVRLDGPPPGGGPATGSQRPPPPGGGPASGGQRPARPGGDGRRPPEAGVALVVDRSTRNAVFGRGLSCSGVDGAATVPAPGERFTLGVDARAGEVAVSVDGAPVARCRGTWTPGAVVLAAGVRRIQITSFQAPGLSEGFGGPVRSPFFGAGLALVAALAGRSLPRRYAIALTPALALPLLGAIDTRALLDTLRILSVPEALGPPLLAGVPAVVVCILVFASAAGTLSQACLRGTVGLLVGATAGALSPSDLAGCLMLGALGVPLGALGWINTHPFRRRVACSWALTVVLCGGAEVGLRYTALGQTWTRTAGWRRASDEFGELLELRQYRTYPDEGFPVRPPEPTQRRRIVALGGSSTGGAYQMDDLDLFWPTRLAERLGDHWEVVNQGVGGWNTLHIRLYVESQIERLGGEIYVLYVGHNDVLTTSPIPYRELYASWSRGDAGLQRAVDYANQSRLYVGLKFALFALRERRAAVAVPVPDAAENLAAIARLVNGRGGHVLFMNEGLNPDPLPMAPYGEMLAGLAADTGARYLDAARALADAGDPDLFLDDCHLSVEGHIRLATWVEQDLTAAGWLR